MGIAIAATFAWTGLLAMIVGLGLRIHPRASLLIAVLGDVVAIATVLVLIGAPMVFGARLELYPSIATNYFLATAHRLIGGPYPFFWTPRWMYLVGSLTPLIPLGSLVALVAGFSAMPRARRTAAFVVAVASCLLAAYVAAGMYAVATTWGGVPL